MEIKFDQIARFQRRPGNGVSFVLLDEWNNVSMIFCMDENGFVRGKHTLCQTRRLLSYRLGLRKEEVRENSN